VNFWTQLVLAGSVGFAVAILGITIQRLLKEIRYSTQQWRARVTDLEREKDSLINQAAAAQGVGIDGAPSNPLRSEWTDPETGYVHFSDGEIKDSFGKTVIAAGSIELLSEQERDE